MTEAHTMNVLEHALAYAAIGWAVLPLHGIVQGRCTCGDINCSKRGKHPIPRNGLKEATTDEGTIRNWWREFPDANVGIATGEVSGLIVIDVDDGPEKAGFSSLEALQSKHGTIPREACVRTGGGGLHIYLAAPGQLVRSSAGKLAPNIDVRGEGGYVVAPPSLHVSGRNYVWETHHAA